MPQREILCLIAEPDDQIRALLESTLESSANALGIDTAIVSVDDGRAALQALRSRPPQLVICEVLLEVVNGLQLLRHCRDSVDTAHARWIFASGLTENTDRYWASLNDCDEYVTKPIDSAILATVLKHHLESLSRGESRRSKRREGVFP